MGRNKVDSERRQIMKKTIIKWLIKHLLKGYSLHRNPIRRKREVK